VVELKPGLAQATFTATFDQLGYSQVSAALEAEETGLTVDNTRYAAVEVREKVPLLFVEGDLSNRGKPDGDAYYLPALVLDATRGLDVVARGAEEREQPNPDHSRGFFVLKVPRFNDKARANLAASARHGGGVCFMLGEAVDADFYNQRLYADG